MMTWLTIEIFSEVANLTIGEVQSKEKLKVDEIKSKKVQKNEEKS